MKNIGIIGTISFGPWVIPQRVQSLVINDYIKKQNKKIDYMVSEFVFTKNFFNLRNRLLKEEKSNLFFVSVYQFQNYENFMQNYRLISSHNLFFILENIQINELDENNKITISCIFNSKTLKSPQIFS
jgi:sporadic carbohydrate cluster protein (TIGR04323 family)